MKFQELDVVRVTAQLPEDRVDADFGDASTPLIGDVGTIVNAYPVPTGQEPVFMVECVSPEGVVRWLADLYQSELELVSSALRAMPDDPKPAPPRGTT